MELTRVKDSILGRDLLPCVSERLAQLISEGKLQPVERAAAGRTLAKLGDPRPGVGVSIHDNTELPDILWCHIPTGEFWMGSDKQADKDACDNEFPQHKLTLLEFYISRYPITHAQFMAFVKAGGYQEPKYWQEAQQADVWQDGKVKGYRDKNPRSQPENFGEPFNLSNHPVVAVTWYEALAFCRWLEGKLLGSADHFQIATMQNENIIQQKLSSLTWWLTLPSEDEWEKAARDSDKRIFPWGDEPDPNRANYHESGIGTSSAVGCFPGGMNPLTGGLLDMSGNVYEWTRSNYEKYPYQTKSETLYACGDRPRVVRGGAFRSSPGGVRCAFRVWYLPDNGYDNLGFRVVVSPQSIF